MVRETVTTRRNVIVFQIAGKTYKIETQPMTFKANIDEATKTMFLAIAVSGLEKLTIPDTIARTPGEAKLLGYLNIAELFDDELKIIIQQ